MKHKSAKICRSAACIALTAVMSATFIAGQALAFADGSSQSVASYGESVNFENVTGKVDLTGVKLNNMSSAVMKNDGASVSDSNQKKTVIVSLEGETLMDKADTMTVSEYIATPIGKTEARAIAERQNEFLSALSKKGVEYEQVSSYDTVLNAVALTVKVGDVAKIKAMNGVKSAFFASTYEAPKAAESSSGGAQFNESNIYENGIYKSSAYLDKYDGSGMTVAILDTGIDYTHDAFSRMPTEVKYTAEDIERKMDGTTFKAELRSGATADDVYVSPKIPFAYDYADKDADVYPSYSQHGTHVAGIVAGRDDGYVNKDGEEARDEEGNLLEFYGVAPNAQLVICKVFTDNLESESIGGAETQDILDALEDCVKLDVDIINMSLGTSAGFSSAALTIGDSEGENMNTVYESIRSAGITLMVAASNDFSSGYGSAFGTNLASNPDSGTVGSPSTFSGAMSVASINGQLSPYLLANATQAADGSVSGGDAIYYEESRNEDSDAYNFLNDMLGDPEKDTSVNQSGKFKYVVVPGTGAAGDYTSSIKNEIKDKSEGKVIAVIKRGNSTFKEKLETAKSNGADAVIVYNNVAGLIRMSLGDMQEHIPAISVSLEAGQALTGTGSGRKTVGYIYMNRSYSAGPFMNDYSSWGTTPDLKLKPDITAHGGEITSTVAGGYDEMSGTSMACPNLAGFTALFKSYVKKELSSLYTANGGTAEAVALTKLTNQIMMSTAVTVYDQNSLPYSPRKQGAGLASLDNVFSTKAYLYTDEADGMCEDGRPKAELGEDKDKKGEYTIKFTVRNFGDSALSFSTKTLFMTETMSPDRKSVAEKAHLFDSVAKWSVEGVGEVAEGASFSVPANSERKITAQLTLSASEKKYLNDNFKNGMYVEGFLQLRSADDKQCDLSLPFMGFYGDWKSAPLLDYNCFEIAAFDKDTSYSDEERPSESVWATQAYSYYYNEKYTTPLGSFLYIQDEEKEHTNEYVYTEEEHVAISRFNEYNEEDVNQSYLTTTGIKALYAGLLRNAELVTYKLTNVDTGEVIPDDEGNEIREVYRVHKAMASGGGAVPAQVLMELRTDDLGLAANGKYRLDFSFYFDYEDREQPTDQTFSMTFYVDYEAPILVDSRIRYQDFKDTSNKDSQRVYLDLDIYDNHYPQAVILCYSENGDATDAASIKLATEYITPVLNPKKNDTTVVSIEITEFFEEYKNKLYVEIDDYAMNHNVYKIDFNHSTSSVSPAEFELTDGNEMTLAVNEAKKIGITYEGNANLSNFIYRAVNKKIATVKNGEVFGVSEGTTSIIVTGAGGHAETLKVTVKDEGKTLRLPSISFGNVLNSDESPVKASGMVEVNPGQVMQLNIVPDPWYYPIENLEFNWTSSDPTVASVDENGVVKVYEHDKMKMVTITATCKTSPSCSTNVIFSVKEPCTVSNGTLSKYNGWGGGTLVDGEIVGEPVTIGGEQVTARVLRIPTDKAITAIGQEAFKDNQNVEVVVIPKSVTTIAENAFEDCTNLKMICFVDLEKQPVADSSLNLITRYAFKGCTSLTTLDFSNCKVFTIDRVAFRNCVSLKNIINAQAIGTIYDGAFSGCTSLESVDLTALHAVGYGVFRGCTSLAEVITGKNTALGAAMFRGCTSLRSVNINCAEVPAYAFAGCSSLETLTFGDAAAQAADKNTVFNIGANAFNACSSLKEVDFNGYAVASIGDGAFANCSALTTVSLPTGNTQFGRDVFSYVNVTFEGADYEIENGAVYRGNTLVIAPSKVNSSFALRAGTEEIGPYAFSGSKLEGVTSLDLTSITKIGEGAFYDVKELTGVTLNPALTEIAPYAFCGTALTAITIPSTVVGIGEGAFANCSDLASVVYADNCPALKSIGTLAFFNTALTQVSLPDGVEKMGDGVFENCVNLTVAELPSLKSLGSYTFAGCSSLRSATFGSDAETLGEYTFAAIDYSNNTQVASALTSVTFGEKITKLGAGVFAYCTSLKEINLNAITEIGENAFNCCTALTRVDGLNKVTLVDRYAFRGCTSLTSVDLSAVKSVYYQAFWNCTSLGSVTFGEALEGIGDEAFSECDLTTVSIPANCSYVGTSAFSGNALTSIRADGEHYFDVDGVLFRYIDKEAGTYELVAYPAGKAAKAENGVLTYTVPDGTITIKDFAFYSVEDKKIAKVVLPYTLKTIGNGAFYGAGATEYEFHSIAAPVLLEGVSEQIIKDDYSTYSFFYNNFYDYLAYTSPHSPGASAEYASVLKVYYPTNGTGYANFVYSHFFGRAELTGEHPEDDTRILKTMLEGFVDAETVSGWNSGNTTKEAVEAFSGQVTDAHIKMNALKTDYQREYVGEELFTKLANIETALRPVKSAFGIRVGIRSTSVDASSTHKTQYSVGEKFSLDGIKIKVVYTDYAEEIVDASGNFVLSEDSDHALTVDDTVVYIVGTGAYAGQRRSIAINVAEGAVTNTESGSMPPWAIIVIVVGAVILLAGAAVAVILVLKKGKKAGKVQDTESAVASGEESGAEEESGTEEEQESATEDGEDEGRNE